MVGYLSMQRGFMEIPLNSFYEILALVGFGQKAHTQLVTVNKNTINFRSKQQFQIKNSMMLIKQ